MASGEITGTDFVSVPTADLERAVAFYGQTLGLRRSVHMPERSYAEFETGNLTLSVINPQQMGIATAHEPSRAWIALHVEDMASARSELERRGVSFEGEVFDTGVCFMSFFKDPDGNALMLHQRYAPRLTES